MSLDFFAAVDAGFDILAVAEDVEACEEEDFSDVCEAEPFSFCFPNICSSPDFGLVISAFGLITSGFFSSLTLTSGVCLEALGVARLFTMPLKAVVGLNSFLK